MKQQVKRDNVLGIIDKKQGHRQVEIKQKEALITDLGHTINFGL